MEPGEPPVVDSGEPRVRPVDFETGVESGERPVTPVAFDIGVGSGAPPVVDTGEPPLFPLLFLRQRWKQVRRLTLDLFLLSLLGHIHGGILLNAI